MLFDFRSVIHLLDQLDGIGTGLVIPHQRVKYHAENAVQVLLLLDLVQGRIRLVEWDVLLPARFDECLIHARAWFGLGSAGVGWILWENKLFHHLLVRR